MILLKGSWIVEVEGFINGLRIRWLVIFFLSFGRKRINVIMVGVI